MSRNVVIAVVMAALAIGSAPFAAPGQFRGQFIGAASGFVTIATIDVRVNPFGITTAPDGATVWVANSGPLGAPGNTVTVVDASTFAIQAVIDVGRFPEDVAFTSTGAQAFVTNSTDATVSVIDAPGRRVTQAVDLAPIPMQFPFGIGVDRTDRKVFVTSAGGQRDTSLRNVGILDNADPASVTVGGAIAVQGFTGRPALTPDGSLFVVPRSRGDLGPPEVLLVDPVADQVAASILLPGSPAVLVGAVFDVAVTPDGRFAYAGVFGDRGGVWVIDLATRTTAVTIPLGTRVHGIGITPDGRFVFATKFVTGQVAVISTATNEVVATVTVGNLPNEVAVSKDSTRAFITNQGDTTVSVIGIPSP